MSAAYTPLKDLVNNMTFQYLLNVSRDGTQTPPQGTLP